jgi:hypothetical protein
MAVSMYRIALVRELAPHSSRASSESSSELMLPDAKHRPIGRKGDRREDPR